MGQLIDLIGKKFTRLLVIKRVGRTKDYSPTWLCLCDCGKQMITSTHNLRNKNTRSCGCLRLEVVSSHKMSRSKIYCVWHTMLQKCNNPNNLQYKNYGGRGIKVCKRWMKFENFYKDVGNPPFPRAQIDRINNGKGYFPDNWRWATNKINSRNKRNNIIINYNNKKQCLIEWSEETGIKASVISVRLKRGWSIKKALTTPVRKHNTNE